MVRRSKILGSGKYVDSEDYQDLEKSYNEELGKNKQLQEDVKQAQESLEGAKVKFRKLLVGKYILILYFNDL